MNTSELNNLIEAGRNLSRAITRLRGLSDPEVIRWLKLHPDALATWNKFEIRSARAAGIEINGPESTAKVPPPEMVPVKTKYPGIPPAYEPLWVHMDWIQTTASSQLEWANSIDRRQNWSTLRRAGIDPTNDPSIQHEMEKWNRLWEEVIPLFAAAKQHLPLEIWSQFKHIRSPHDAEAHPAKAVREWGKLRDYALDSLAKMPKLDDPNTVAALATTRHLDQPSTAGTSAIPPGTYETYRSMLEHSAIRSARNRLVERITTAEWRYELRESITKPIPDPVLKSLKRLPEMLIINAATMVDFGWAAFEMVLEPVSGYIVLDKLKWLLPDITTILEDQFGDFAGLKNKEVTLQANKSLCVSLRPPADRRPVGYGRSQLENVRLLWGRWKTGVEDGDISQRLYVGYLGGSADPETMDLEVRQVLNECQGALDALSNMLLEYNVGPDTIGLLKWNYSLPISVESGYVPPTQTRIPKPLTTESEGSGRHAPSRVIHANNYFEGNPPMSNPPYSPRRSPWASGSFYLISVVVVAFVLLAFGKLLSPWWIPVAVLGTILIVTVVGALQLQQDDKLSQANFLKLMHLAFSQIPLLGKLAPTKSTSD